jgi:tRNA dimethylallyltransferase
MILKKYSNENNEIRAVIICGPTGSGKSSFAMDLAGRFSGRIIGADSRQIYRRLDIGTAKPTKADRTKICHYMIDIADIIDNFTAKKYAEMASIAIKETAAAGAVPFIVGGAGMYLEALTAGLFDGPERDNSVRTELELLSRTSDPLALHNELAAIDPQSAKQISPHDNVRIIRALEVYRLTGTPLSQLKTEQTNQMLKASYLWIGLTYPRDKLYERINLRVDQMISDGLVDEVNDLLRDGLGNPIIEKGIVGYAEIIEAIQNKTGLKEAIELVKQHSRNYAKRQLTWFRNKAPVNWITLDSTSSSDNINNLIEKHLTKELDT